MGNIICTDKGSYDTDTAEGCYRYLSCELGLSSDKLAMLNLIYRNTRADIPEEVVRAAERAWYALDLAAIAPEVADKLERAIAKWRGRG